VFSVRYEHHPHIKSKAIAIKDRGAHTRVSCEVRQYLHMKSKAIPVTGRGDHRRVSCEV
jgi:hypothetical protein